MITDLRINDKDFSCGIERTAVFSWETDFKVKKFLAELQGGGKSFKEEVESSVCRYDFNGKFLPLTDYKFTVTCFSEDGKEESASLSFRTALTCGFPDECKWIGDERIPADKQNFAGNPATVLIKEFDCPSVKRTYLHVAGLGLFIAELNGKKVTNDVLNCPFTDYDKSVLYANYDITDYLKEGKNVLKITLGDGWFNQTATDEWNFYKADWRDNCKAIVYIEGGCTVYSDESWAVSYPVKTVASALRLGERTDYTVSEFSRKKQATEVNPPRGALKSTECNPIRETEIIPYADAKEYDGGYIFDFGTSVTGYVRLKAAFSGEVKIRYGDRLGKNGRIDNASNAQYVYGGEYQTDTVIGDGEVKEYSPLFVYHAFRWIEIEGLKEIPPKTRFNAVFIRNSFKRKGSFSCDNERLNKLYDLSVRSLECNFTGIPTDCPHREKNGWTGDMQLSADAYVKNFSMASDIYKWLEDIADSQKEDGMLPCIVPTSGWGYTWGNGPAWDFALFAVPYALYENYADAHGAKIVYSACEKYLGFLEKRECDGLVNMGLGDWNYPKDGKTEICPTELTCSCYYMAMCEIFSEFSKLFGFSENAEKYEKKAAFIKNSIKKKYADEENYSLKGLTELAALSYFKIVEDDGIIIKTLIEKLEKSGYASYYGILGAKFVHRVLCSRGRTDVFVKIAERTDYPSFGNWLERGATTLWEDFEGTNSRNHHMYADIAAVMQTYVAGVKQTVEGGVPKLVIEPYTEGFKHISATVLTANGEVKADYKIRSDGFTAELNVPFGVEAEFVKGGKTYALTGGFNKLTFEK